MPPSPRFPDPSKDAMTDMPDMPLIERPTCARGCTEGEDATPAKVGVLCYRCSKRLRYSLRDAQGQHDLLLAMLDPSMSASMGMDDADRIKGSNDDLAEAVNPKRLSCAQEMSDVLSQWVEWLAEERSMLGPKRLMTQVDRDVPGRKRRHWSETLAGYIWVDPPLRYDIGSGSRWLEAQIEALCSTAWIADELGPWFDLCSNAHGLAPWRAESVKIPEQITCPNCHAATLRIFGGEDDVTCTSCRSMFDPQRYAIWERMLRVGQ